MATLQSVFMFTASLDFLANFELLHQELRIRCRCGIVGKLDAAQLTDKFGVTPAQIADYLALTGDAVDNIPGVPGIGPKSAAALLSHFGDLDSLFSRLDEVPFLSIRGAKSLHRKLAEHREAAELARRLTVIDTGVESALAAPDISRAETDADALNSLFDELSFGGLLRNRCLRA